MILILCENILYGITDQANVKFMKRLDYSPICFSSFVSGWYYGLCLCVHCAMCTP